MRMYMKRPLGNRETRISHSYRDSVVLCSAILLCLAYVGLGFGDALAQTDAQHMLTHGLDFHMSLSSSYDSNINHDDQPVQAYGLIRGLQIRYRLRPSDPILTLAYTISLHSYTSTDEWDRVSNQIQLYFEPEISHRVHAETSVEVSLKGSSEDRDLADQYCLAQEFEYRFTRNNRLQFYGTSRWKRFPDAPDRNAVKPNVGLVFQRRLSQGERWEVGARYEINDAQILRSEYTRWTFEIEYQTPIAGSGDQIEFKAAYRRKLYKQRFVEIDGEDFQRRDYRWILNAVWKRPLLPALRAELGFTLETRDSNDPAKRFAAYLLGIVLTYSR